MDRNVLQIVLACALYLIATDLAMARDPFKLLKLQHHLVKWGHATLGTSAKASVGFVGGIRHFPDARNCRAMQPLTGLLRGAGLSGEQMEAALAGALRSWSDVAGIRFRIVAPGEKADILIGAQVHPRGRAYANVDLHNGDAPKSRHGVPAVNSTHALSRYDARAAGARESLMSLPKPEKIHRIKQATVCLNPDWKWKIGFDGDLQSYDLRYTLTHEIGHAIGLDHPSGRGQLMSFRYQETFSGLQPGDIAGARRLYGRPR